MALEKAGISIDDVKAIKTHNPFAGNDVYLADQMNIDVNGFNNYGCSLIYGHPQAPTAGRLNPAEGHHRRALHPIGALLPVLAAHDPLEVERDARRQSLSGPGAHAALESRGDRVRLTDRLQQPLHQRPEQRRQAAARIVGEVATLDPAFETKRPGNTVTGVIESPKGRTVAIDAVTVLTTGRTHRIRPAGDVTIEITVGK